MKGTMRQRRTPTVTDSLVLSPWRIPASAIRSVCSALLLLLLLLLSGSSSITRRRNGGVTSSSSWSGIGTSAAALLGLPVLPTLLFLPSLFPHRPPLLFAAAYTPLSDATLRALPSAGSDLDPTHGALLAPLLRPRVPGTPGHAAVLAHLVAFFRTQLPAWRVQLHNSTARTPATGDAAVPFVNIVAARDPPGAAPGDVGRLTLAAHYDSKRTPAGFVGATDSAAPCAMLLHVARSVDAALTRKWAAAAAAAAGAHNGGGGGGGGAEDEEEGFGEVKGVQILLLDGEEAFVQWTETDSLYGARYEKNQNIFF
jgi:hypothetical protein